jgi:hypothetical protein
MKQQVIDQLNSRIFGPEDLNNSLQTITMENKYIKSRGRIKRNEKTIERLEDLNLSYLKTITQNASSKLFCFFLIKAY